MGAGMGKSIDTYHLAGTRQFKDCIVRYYFPDLTEEERARRQKIFHETAAWYMKKVLEHENMKELS